MSVCTLRITEKEHADIMRCEAVIVREYEQADGARFACPVAWGDVVDMKEQVGTRVFIVPVGFHIIADTVVLVRELFPVEGSEAP